MRCEFGKPLLAIDLARRMKVSSVSRPYNLFKWYLWLSRISTLFRCYYLPA